jgi:hypothetical protein
MKVISTRPKAFEININCHNCDYWDSHDFYGNTRIDIKNTLAVCRSRARQHVQRTGHKVQIDISYSTVYKPEER